MISTPMNRFFSHLPAWVEASACGICRAIASISVIACSAVVIELPNGVFITMMPLEVAAAMSTLSTPMPARPITLSRRARSSTFGVTLVADRTARPSKSPIRSASLSLSLPSLGWKSTSTPRSAKICTAAGESASEIRTLGRTARLTPPSAGRRCSWRTPSRATGSAPRHRHARRSSRTRCAGPRARRGRRRCRRLRAPSRAARRGP